MSDLLAGPAEASAGLVVHGADAVDRAAPASTRDALVAGGLPGRLAGQDPTLWGPGRLGWLDTHRRSRDLIHQLAELTTELADLDHVVLVGPGGVVSAAEAITRTLGRPLTVLDGTDPGRVRAALADRLERTVVVLADASGTAPETDALRRAYLRAFLDAGLTEAEAGRHFVAVTDPGSALETAAAELGGITVPADPEATGPYGVLTAFGLVPAALAGVEVTELLDQAGALAAALGGDADNPGLALGAALAAAATQGRDVVALAGDGTGLDPLGGWIEQLLATATGKAGVGVLPVVLESPAAPGGTGPDVLAVDFGGALPPGAVPGGGRAPDVAVNGPLGAQFLAWEYAATVAAAALGVDPFDQPDAAEVEERTARALAPDRPAPPPSSAEGAIEVYAPTGAPGDLAGALRHLLDGVGGDGYLAVLAHLDRVGDTAVAGLRPLLAEATGRPVTFGWGQRCLPGTGQYHRGGPRAGNFLQLTGTVDNDLKVPGRAYTFADLQAARAAAERQALADRGRPVLRLHLTDRSAGVAQLLDAVRQLRT